MGTNIFGIGQSALAAAQIGIATTGHNIANASSAGYSRQVVLQSAAESQNIGGAFVGQGVVVGQIKRMYNEFVGQQVNTTQSTKNFSDAYYSQIQQINNLIADPSAGASPAMQEFFDAIQNLAATPNGTAGAAARQSVLSTGSALTSRLQGLQTRLDQLGENVNGQITATVTTINTYATKISDLNQVIERTQNVGGTPNDLLDQRDNLVTELSKLVNVSVVAQGNKLNVFIGSGQPLVLGGKSYSLQTTPSLSDPSRMEVGYETNGSLIQVAESSLTGGQLGGLFSFRTNTLDVSQNSLGRVAIGIATSFNDQHKLGQDLNGKLGEDFFSVAVPLSLPNSTNASATGNMSAEIVKVSELTTSDYRVQYLDSKYKITRLSDGVSATPVSPATSINLPFEFDGIIFKPPTTTPAEGDEFLIRPTANGVTDFKVLIADTSKIAAATPITTNFSSTNTGTGVISAGTVDATFVAGFSAVSLTFDASTNTFSGFPATSAVSLTVNGVPTTYAAGVPVPYTSGATISFDGVSFSMTGAPADKDTFIISPNTNGSGDSRNALLLGKIQTQNILSGSTTSFQGAYAQFVSFVGNKTHELEVSSASEAQLLEQAVRTQQSESGVNLDEEAANLLRYQQAYQAAGKLMQIASQLFDSILALGR